MEYRMYRSSGKAPLGGIILFALFGLIGCVLLEAVSVLLLGFLSNLFLRALAVVVPILGMISWMVLLVRLCKIRNLTLVRIISLIVLIVSFYASRAVYVDMVEELWDNGANEFLKGAGAVGAFLDKFFRLLVRPDVVVSALFKILPYGTTSINGFRLTGVPLLIIWIFGGVVFILVPYYSVVYYANRPYDEDLQMWFPRKEEWHVTYVENYREIRAEMRKGNVRLLLGAFRDLKAYYLKGQESYAIATFYLNGKTVGPYVSLTNIKAVQSGPRKLDHRSITLCRLLGIGREGAEELYHRVRDTYQTEKEKAEKPKLSDRLSQASFDINRASRQMAQDMKTPTDNELKTMTVYTPAVSEQLSLDDLKRSGTEEITVHVPHVTPEMEEEYLNRKKD